MNWKRFCSNKAQESSEKNSVFHSAIGDFSHGFGFEFQRWSVQIKQAGRSGPVAVDNMVQESYHRLSVLQFAADPIAADLGPVQFGPCDGQLATKSFECGVGHGGVVLRDGFLKAYITN